ncbi:GCN5-related N-acetyltransferase [Thermosinus carboxydivorans Nor1]|uniref:GCN5-related N-acetyltransferase n=1 Tax=Thermosinus carboxydivorans Nor1 TaxID=401526 RepID=A1HR81_9FIRM|nr:GNAT family N-acetyltransferase [Thermosinus carboxydivorans]EAX47397.1 GCN5-related N-acetyltransferase [Thermosinus carboxydivorans Nor1]
MRIEQATAADIPAIAAIFTECFKESVLHHCGGRLPKPQAMIDVFTLVYDTEPSAAFVARDGGAVVGYCFAPARLSRLWRRAVLSGALFRWGWRWVTGRYGFGLHPFKIIVLNKLAFLRSAVAPAKAADARILSIAVTKACRGRGVASALMDAALAYFRSCRVRRVRLEVRPDNAPAIRVYEKHGFVRGGVTYDSQGPWLIMFKEMGAGNV